MCDKEFLILLIGAVVTFLATFFGAWFAYRLQNRREKLKEEKSQKTALNTALFILLRQYNALKNLKKSLIELEKDESRAFKLRPFKTNEYNDLKFDMESLNFLIETDTPQILSDLFIEQERFEQVLSAIKVRSQYQVKVIEPLLQKSGLGNKKVPFEVLSNELGRDNLEGLILGTDEVYFHVYSSYESVEKLLLNLHLYAKKLFPKASFIKID